MSTTGELFCNFISELKPEFPLPNDISVINPYRDSKVRDLLKKFCLKYYGNKRKRVLILGINPGRFGAGITGIPFTDPVALETFCGIHNDLEKRKELSSSFVYEFIETFGGPGKFYDSFLLSAVCPLGFLSGTKNFNYYDLPELIQNSHKFICESLTAHFSMNVSRKVIICLGKKNATHLEKINGELHLFDKLITLDHPRFIMQYRLRNKEKYIDDYVTVLNECKL